MSTINADTIKLEKFISDLNDCSLNFKNHAEVFNDQILKTETCWSGKAADEYRGLADSFYKEQFEQFYLMLSSLVDTLSNVQRNLESVIDSNKE